MRVIRPDSYGGTWLTNPWVQELKDLQRVLVDIIDARYIPAEDSLGKDDDRAESFDVVVHLETVFIRSGYLERNAVTSLQLSHGGTNVVDLRAVVSL